MKKNADGSPNPSASGLISFGLRNQIGEKGKIGGKRLGDRRDLSGRGYVLLTVSER